MTVVVSTITLIVFVLAYRFIIQKAPKYTKPMTVFLAVICGLYTVIYVADFIITGKYQSFNPSWLGMLLIIILYFSAAVGFVQWLKKRNEPEVPPCPISELKKLQEQAAKKNTDNQ